MAAVGGMAVEGMPVESMCLTARRFIGISFGSTWLAVVLAMAPAGAAESGGSSAPVTLRIVNATAGSPLACQLILAHFVTQDAGRIDAGREATIDLRRRTADGTLIYGADESRPMAVENVLCGRDGDWAAEKVDLSLAALRNGSRDSLRIVCSGAKELVCKAVP